MGEQKTGERWCLGAVSPKKVVHRSGCSSARGDYSWAQEYGTPFELAEALVASGGHNWHRACRRCCGDLDEAIFDAIRTAR